MVAWFNEEQKWFTKEALRRAHAPQANPFTKPKHNFTNQSFQKYEYLKKVSSSC